MSEEIAAPEAAEVVSAPEPSAPEPSSSLDDSISRALEKAGREPVSDKSEISETHEGDEVRPRDEHGRFKAKEAAETVVEEVAEEDDDPHPDWLAEPARPQWKATPKEIRAEYARRLGEMEKGIAEYQQRFAPLKEFHDLASQQGTTLADAMRNYVGIERQLRQDPVKGVETILRNMGIDIRKFAEHVVNQPAKTPEQVQAERQMEAVRAREAQLERQNAALAQQMIDSFASQPQFSRFEELSADIAKALQTGYASNLAEAYAFAERLNPAPAPAGAHTPSAPPAAQTRAKAPPPLEGTPGSNPRSRPPAKNIDDALTRAFAATGIG